MMGIINLNLISSIIGIVGGILGCWYFIDNYLLKFNPKFKISDSLMFRYTLKIEQNKTYKYISAIFLKINILNTRNKIGRIDDIALRIYDANQSSENSYMFFATTIYDKTFSLESIAKGNGSIFSAISVLNKSDYSTVLELTPEDDCHPEIHSSNVVIDLIYLSTKKEWCSVGTYNLHSIIKEEIKDQDIIMYTSTHSWSLKRNIKTIPGDINNI